MKYEELVAGVNKYVEKRLEKCSEYEMKYNKLGVIDCIRIIELNRIGNLLERLIEEVKK